MVDSRKTGFGHVLLASTKKTAVGQMPARTVVLVKNRLAGIESQPTKL